MLETYTSLLERRGDLSADELAEISARFGDELDRALRINRAYEGGTHETNQVRPVHPTGQRPPLSTGNHTGPRPMQTGDVANQTGGFDHHTGDFSRQTGDFHARQPGEPTNMDIDGAGFATMAAAWPDRTTTLIILAMGAAGAIGMAAMAIGYRSAPSSYAALFDYSFLIWIPLFAWIFHREVLSTSMAAGIGLIILAGIVALSSAPAEEARAEV